MKRVMKLTGRHVVAGLPLVMWRRVQEFSRQSQCFVLQQPGVTLFDDHITATESCRAERHQAASCHHHTSCDQPRPPAETWNRSFVSTNAHQFTPGILQLCNRYCTFWTFHVTSYDCRSMAVAFLLRTIRCRLRYRASVYLRRPSG